MSVTDVEGSGPPEHFGFGDRLEIIVAESRRMADAVGALDLETTVPTTPEWTVRDLAHHIGEVQWYWAENVRAQNADVRSGAQLTGFPEDADLLSWLGWCTYSLLSALREVGPDVPCWAWWPEPHTAGAVGGTRPRRCPCTAGTPKGWPVPRAHCTPAWPTTECPSSLRSWWGPIWRRSPAP